MSAQHIWREIRALVITNNEDYTRIIAVAHEQ